VLFNLLSTFYPALLHRTKMGSKKYPSVLPVSRGSQLFLRFLGHRVQCTQFTQFCFATIRDVTEEEKVVWSLTPTMIIKFEHSILKALNPEKIKSLSVSRICVGRIDNTGC